MTPKKKSKMSQRRKVTKEVRWSHSIKSKKISSMPFLNMMSQSVEKSSQTLQMLSMLPNPNLSQNAQMLCRQSLNRNQPSKSTHALKRKSFLQEGAIRCLSANPQTECHSPPARILKTSAPRSLRHTEKAP